MAAIRSEEISYELDIDEDEQTEVIHGLCSHIITVAYARKSLVKEEKVPTEKQMDVDNVEQEE